VSELIPTELPAGVTITLPITLTAYPAPTWTLTLHLRGALAIDLTAADDDTNHVFEVAAETSTAWPAGRYWYTLRATDGTAIDEVEAGQITIRADLSEISGIYDGRHHVEKVLDAIEAVIEGRATLDQERYRINNRELQRTPIGELIKLRQTYQAEARRLAAARKGTGLLGRPVLTVF